MWYCGRNWQVECIKCIRINYEVIMYQFHFVEEYVLCPSY